MRIVNTKGHPLEKVVRQVSRKRTFIESDSMTPAWDPNWSGGSRDEAFILRPGSDRLEPLQGDRDGPSGAGIDAAFGLSMRRHAIQPGEVVVVAGTSMGKPSTPVVYGRR